MHPSIHVLEHTRLRGPHTVIYSALSSKFLTRVNKWWCFDIFAAHHDGAWRARIRVSAFAARKSSQIYHSYIASERGGE